ncbi:MAG: hypothetical protein WCV91_04305 [Candidatus Margulisiibacteriota bacterium]
MSGPRSITGASVVRIRPNTLQIGKEVRAFFKSTGVQSNRTLSDRLKKYSAEQIQQIARRIGELQAAAKVNTVIIDDISAVQSEFDFNTILPEQLQRRLVDGVIDLRGNWQAADPFAGPYATLCVSPSTYSDPAIIRLSPKTAALMATMSEIVREIGLFAAQEKTKVADIFRMLEDQRGRLGFLNVSVLRPIGDGKWIRSQSTRSWGPTRYDPATGGSELEGTYKSVVDGGNAINLYDVDINDKATFEAAELFFDEASVARDLASSKGPGRMLFIVLPGRNGVRAVVQIHSRINLDETIETPPVLPENVREAETLKRTLTDFFGSVNLALQVALEREMLTSSGQKAYVRPLAGQKKAPASVPQAVSRQASTALPVSRTKYFLYIYLLTPYRTIRNLYRALPRDLETVRSFFRKDFALLKEAGAKKVIKEIFKTFGSFCSAIVDFISLWTPRLSKTAVPGRFGFLVHPRDINDLYRPFPFFRYLPESLVMEIVKYLPPMMIAKMTGLKLQKRDTDIFGVLFGIMMDPQQHMAKEPLLAVHRARQAIRLASKMKVSFLGLGALIPALTRYGTIPRGEGASIGITTGHAFTSLIIARTALKVKGLISPDKEEMIAVVGAAGSTGSASAKILAASGARKLLLIDLDSKAKKLEELKAEIIATNPEAAWDIQLSTRLEDISRTRIIVTVTNSPKAIITGEMLKPGMIFVDDAQPPNISEEVALAHKEVRILKVLADVPGLDPHFDFGLGTPPNVTFTCLAEAAAYAMHGMSDDGTVGFVQPGEVDRIDALTAETGITIPVNFYGYRGEVYSPEDIQQVAGRWAA